MESRLLTLVRERGPLTVAAFMDLALYDPEVGYYARSAQRSGRAGDFFTSVDVGPLFGELLAIQIQEMAAIVKATAGHAEHADDNKGSAGSAVPFDLVEAGAGNGRLSADILRAVRARHPLLYESIRLHLVETSATARAAQRATLDDVADRLVWSCASLPDSFEGVLVANELLDSMPVHQVVMRDDGLREIYVAVRSPEGSRSEDPDAVARGSSRASRGFSRALMTVEGPLSSPLLQQYLDRLGIELEPGWIAEINLRAVDWIRDLARRLRRGFILVIDYGHDARELYSATHSAGTLTTFSHHHAEGADVATQAWLRNAGEQDITAHVDLTSIRDAAEREGMTTIGLLDQTYFVLALVGDAESLGKLANREALKTLVLPGGLGSTHKVLILGKGVGRPALRGCSFRMRVT